MAALKSELGLLVMETRGATYIDLARSQLACAALSHGADVTVFIDHDILFDALDVARIADVARETRGVVGAPYSARKMGSVIVGAFDPQVEQVTFFEGGGLYPAAGVIGMGFTAIHRDAYALLAAQPEYAEVGSQEGNLRPYFQKLFVDGYWMTEDVSFCHAVRKYGGSAHLDTRIRVKHLGDHPFDIEDCTRRGAEKPSLRLKVKANP